MFNYQKKFKEQYQGLNVVFKDGGINNPEKKYNVFEGKDLLKALDTLADAKRFAGEFLRLKAGFEEIKAFYLKNEKLPAYASLDIFERQLAFRLNGILCNYNKIKLLAKYDDFDYLGVKRLKEILESA